MELSTVEVVKSKTQPLSALCTTADISPNVPGLSQRPITSSYSKDHVCDSNMDALVLCFQACSNSCWPIIHADRHIYLLSNYTEKSRNIENTNSKHYFKIFTFSQNLLCLERFTGYLTEKRDGINISSMGNLVI